jgi:acetate kinase
VNAQRSVLAVNAGSSTVKCALFTVHSTPCLLGRETIEQTGPTSAPQLLDWAEAHATQAPLAVIGHRVVHGGPRHQDPQRISDELLDELEELIPFAPNHLPDEIALIRALQRNRPEVPQIACFDTAFHHNLPDVARSLPIPRKFEERGVRRYGFHGLSYAYLTQEIARLAGRAAANARLVLAHLGNGSSLAAVRNGSCIDTSMGFTPLGGVIMSTRAGDLDPGLVTFLARTEHLSPEQLEELLSKQSGLLGISNVTGDMRRLLEREATDSACRLAVAMYVYQIKKWIGSFAAALGGLDCLVFAGGIGEHAPAIRARVCAELGFLGIEIDEPANQRNASIVSTPGAAAVVRVIPTNEELMIAQAASRLVT